MKKYLIILLILAGLILSIILSSSFSSSVGDVDRIISSLTLDQKIGQLLMFAVPGKKMNREAARLIKEYAPGGVLLFGYNISDKNKTTVFIKDLQKKSIDSSGLPLFVSIDQEGGRVKRITDGVTAFPSFMAAGVSGDRTLISESARIVGMELRIMGVNMNLAPVLDVNNNPENPVINTRSLGSSPAVVSELGSAYISGLQSARCIAVGKHFPGHGDTNKDSHLTLPVIQYDVARLREIEFVPFVNAIKSGIDCIMTAHISFPKILGDNTPATMSKYFLTDVLRGEMGFEGLVITDDMEMNAISGNNDIGSASVKSITGGADVILLSTYGKNVDSIVRSIRKALEDGQITAERLEKSVRRIIELKLRYDIIKLIDGKINIGDITYSSEKTALLSRRDEINKEISRKAICGHNWDDEMALKIADGSTACIFITQSNLFRKEIKSRFKNAVFGSSNDIISKKYTKWKNKNQKELIAFYHVDKVNIEAVKKIQSSAKKSGIKLCVLSTGNPFPLSVLQEPISILYTFSNTDESIRQMAACLSGEFVPQKEINLNLGFNETKAVK